MSEDNEIKNRIRILEAIDQLRRRKARPDLTRICNYMLRRFGVNWKDTRNDLDKCVQREAVFRVEYKGSISYRNASKWNRFRHMDGKMATRFARIAAKTPACPVTGKRFSKVLTNCLSELIVQEPDYLELGIPTKILIQTITDKSDVKYGRKQLLMLIQKEVTNGRLVRLDNGNYSVGSNYVESSEKSDEEDAADVENAPSTSTRTSLRVSKMNSDVKTSDTKQKTGGRKKLAKKVFDPSDTPTVAKRRPGRPVGTFRAVQRFTRTSKTADERRDVSRTVSPATRSSSSGSTTMTRSHASCCVCKQTNKRDHSKMVACKDCNNRAHRSCLTKDDMDTFKSSSLWHCNECRTCVICMDNHAVGAMIRCNVCLDTYHTGCAKVKADTVTWTCRTCDLKNDNTAHSDRSDKHVDTDVTQQLEALTTPVVSNLTIHNDTSSDISSTHNLKVDEDEFVEKTDEKLVNPANGYDPTVPDASEWTSNDVYQYFLKTHPSEAIVFKEQEIDGHSLLLLTRNDVLKSLNLKLGPALRVYKHVLKLQVRRDDLTLGWF